MAWTRLLSERLEHLTTALGISHDELAQVVGTDRKTVSRWLKNEAFPQPGNRSRLDELDALTGRLANTFKSPASSREWLRTESGYFGGLRPIDALLRGRIDAVNAALEALDSGTFA
jgi:transcriptional regulator with XRE-family HTH domain